MNQFTKALPLALLALGLLGCNASTDKVDSPVILTIDGSTTIQFPGSVSVSSAQAAGSAAIGSMTLKTVVKDATVASTDLETIEMESYEVTFARADSGTRLPPPLHESFFGTITPNGTYTLTGFPFMRLSQLTTAPLSDLALRGVDSETGSRTILLTGRLQFFAHTVGGKPVASEVKSFTVEMLP